MAWNESHDVGPAAAFGGSSDYATLNLFKDAHDTGVTPSGGDAIANCRGACQTAQEYWNTFDSGMTSGIKLVIQADTGYECDGTDGDSGSPDYKAIITGRQVLFEATNALWMDWVGFEFSGAPIDLYQDGGGDLRIAKCMWRDMTNSGIWGTSSVDANITVYVGGCLFKDLTTSVSSGIRIQDPNITLEAVNNTAWGCVNGFLKQFGSGTLNVKNCAAGNNTTDFNAIDGNVTNVSGDDTDSDANTEWTNPLTDDFTVVASGGLDAQGTAEAASWFTSLCATDFAGTAWASPPSVGCFEVVAAGGLSIPIARRRGR